MSEVRHAEDTRGKILETALDLFHRGSFKGTSLNQVVEQAGVTKGALFHYFKGKSELGYAIVDECIQQHINETWLEPLATSVDPVSDIKAILEGFARMMEEQPEFIESGCPLNNLAQEMSTQDESFRLRMLKVYDQWEAALEKAIRAGIDAGNVRSEVDPESMAATIVALLEGSIGMIKVNRSRSYCAKTSQGLGNLLDLLKP